MKVATARQMAELDRLSVEKYGTPLYRIDENILIVNISMTKSCHI